MKRAVIALSMLLVAGCGSRRTPPLQIFPDMKDQPKYLPQAASRFFGDGRELRRPVPGTVARGYLKEDDALYTGMRDGAFVSNPLALDRQTLARGQERFNIYCTPCHDRTGSGRGIVALRSSWLASDLTEPRVRQMPDGQIFDTITHGKRTMPGYRFQIDEQDRWAIVAYVRALERAAAGTVADVPEELRGELR
jgi:mono/diheme cytochrome c family protein